MEKQIIDTENAIEKRELKFYDSKITHMEIRRLHEIEAKSADGYHIGYSREHVEDREHNETICLEIRLVDNGTLVKFEIYGAFTVLSDWEEKRLLGVTLAHLHSIARGVICSFTSLTGNTIRLPFVNFEALLEDEETNTN